MALGWDDPIAEDDVESVTVSLPRPTNPQKFTIHRVTSAGIRTGELFTSEDMKTYGEEKTQPGPEPEMFTRADQPMPPAEVPCPRMVNAPMEKGTRCYLCARFLDFYFERSPGDYSKICSHCVWDHLGYEAVPDGQGQLRRRPEEERLRK